MSDIQTLIQTVQAESLETRGILSDTLDYNDLMVELLTDIRQSILAIQDTLFDFFDAEAQRYEEARLAAVERMREQSEALTTSQLPTTTTATSDGGGIGGLGAFAIGSLVALPALAAGLVEGIFDSIKAAIKLLRIDRLFQPITRILDSAFGKESKLAKMLDDVFVRIFVLYDDYIAKPLQKFGNFLKRIGNFFIMDNIGGPVTKGAEAIGGFFKSIAQTFGRYINLFRGIGRLVGRAIPFVGIILSIFDTVTGAIEGFQEQQGSLLQKLTAGLVGGFEGLVTGIFAIPMDLLKDGVSWIAEKLGATDVAEYLDSFSFEDIVGKFFDGLKDFLVNIDQYVSAAIDRGKDLLYSIGRTLKISDYDPEAEQRIAQRAITSAQSEIAELEAKDFSSLPEGKRRQAEANRAKRITELQSNITEAQQRSESATQAISAAEAAAAPEPPPPPPPSDLFQVMNAQGEVTNQFSTYEEAAAAAAELGGGAYAMANPNPTPAEEKTIAATEKTADATETLVEKATEKGSLYVHDIHVEKAITPLVEAMSSYMSTINGGNQTSTSSNVTSGNQTLTSSNVTGGNQVSTSSNVTGGNQVLQGSSIISGIQNITSLNPTNINSSVVTTQNGILAAPVGQASREVQSQSSAPIVISSTQGGSTVNNMVNNSSTTVMGGGASARSSDISHRRLQDRMQGI